MKVITTQLMQAFQPNTYIIIDDCDCKTAVVIDPTGDTDGANIIMSHINEQGAKLTTVLLTHGHFDHTSGVAALRTVCDNPFKVYIHAADAPMLSDPDKAFATHFMDLYVPCTADVLMSGDVKWLPNRLPVPTEVIIAGGLHFEVVSSPGHSKGSVLYTTSDSDGRSYMFSGDTLFKGSVGRVDGWGGNHDEQMKTMRLLCEIAKHCDYNVMPGHGTGTTLSREVKTNSFMR